MQTPARRRFRAPGTWAEVAWRAGRPKCWGTTQVGLLTHTPTGTGQATRVQRGSGEAGSGRVAPAKLGSACPPDSKAVFSDTLPQSRTAGRGFVTWIRHGDMCSAWVSGEGGCVFHEPLTPASLAEMAICFASETEGGLGVQGLTGWVDSGTYKRHLAWCLFVGLVWPFAGTPPRPHEPHVSRGICRLILPRWGAPDPR